MEFIVAKNAGFCFGVKRAIDETYRILNSSSKKVYSIGSLIHNELVINELYDKGLVEINDFDDICSLHDEKVIIRTHGIEKETYKLLKKNGNDIINLTCPFVSKIHNIVKEYSDLGYKILVIGDKNHPEVKGIVSYGKEVSVVFSENDIKNLDISPNTQILVVFQTTTNATFAEKLVDILRDFYYNIKVINTICNTTIDRQDEVMSLAKVLDVMLIIGSKNSSNTMKLYDISKMYCKDTYILSDKSDLKNINIKKDSKVGVCAGASTPQYLIEEILTNARKQF